MPIYPRFVSNDQYIEHYRHSGHHVMGSDGYYRFLPSHINALKAKEGPPYVHSNHMARVVMDKNWPGEYHLSTQEQRLADERCRVRPGGPPVWTAVKFGTLEDLQTAIDTGADVNEFGGNESRSPLHEAVINKDHAKARLLVNNGADLYATLGDTHGNYSGMTPERLAQELNEWSPVHAILKFAPQLLLKQMTARFEASEMQVQKLQREVTQLKRELHEQCSHTDI
jgi:hypothetical protein